VRCGRRPARFGQAGGLRRRRRGDGGPIHPSSSGGVVDTTFDLTDSFCDRGPGMATMRATVFHGANDIHLEEVERPRAGPGEAVIRITLTTICGSDLHIVSGKYAVRPGLVIG